MYLYAMYTAVLFLCDLYRTAEPQPHLSKTNQANYSNIVFVFLQNLCYLHLYSQCHQRPIRAF